MRTNVFGIGFAVNDHHIALFMHGNHVTVAKTELGGASCDGGNEVPPSLGGIGLQSVAVD